MRKIQTVFFIFLACIFSSAAFAQQKYALLVGINKYYTGPGIPYPSALRGCVNDALAMKSVLVKRFGFAEDNVETLFDENASKQHVTDEFNRILNKCKAGDAVVFYFSGHGVWMKNDRQNPLDTAVKRNMNQAMVMSDLYAPNLDCLFTDALVKRIFNKFIDKKVIPTAIFDCCFSGLIPASFEFNSMNPYELDIPAYGTDKSLSFSDIYDISTGYTEVTTGSFSKDSLNALLINRLADPDSKSFSLKDALHIRDSSLITRPAERPGSMFLSLGATNEYEKGLDIADESETYHGAYTAALLHVIRANPSTMSVAELIRKTNAEMKIQCYPQTPIHLEDRQRLTKNLIGISPVNFNNDITATCTKNSGKEILLDAGLLNGIGRDNLLQSENKKGTLRITAAQTNTSNATVISGDAAGIRTGDRFILSNRITGSTALVKVFFTGADISSEDFNRHMQEDVKPFVELPGYRDYMNWEKNLSRNVFFSGNFSTTADTKRILMRTVKEDVLVFLPIPSFVTEPLKKIISKNQNVSFVNTAAEADLILYLNYTKAQKDKPAKYIFTWSNIGNTEMNEPGMLRFYKSYAGVSRLTADVNENKALALRINNLLAPYIRSRTTHWLNDWPE